MSTTTHHFAPEEIMAFVDSELSADRAQSISAHIESCVECRAVSQQLRSTTHALSLWNAGEPSAATEDRVLASAAKNLAPTGNLSAAMFQRTKFWTWKHWMRGLAQVAGAGRKSDEGGARLLSKLDSKPADDRAHGIARNRRKGLRRRARGAGHHPRAAQRLCRRVERRYPSGRRAHTSGVPSHPRAATRRGSH